MNNSKENFVNILAADFIYATIDDFIHNDNSDEYMDVRYTDHFRYSKSMYFQDQNLFIPVGTAFDFKTVGETELRIFLVDN